jgi:acetyl esterase/lipase
MRRNKIININIVPAFFCTTLFLTGILLQACESKKDADRNSNQTQIELPNADTASYKIKDLQPANAKPEWAPGISANMQVVIEKLQSFNSKPIEQLSAAEARKNPTPTDAVEEVMRLNSIQGPSMSVDTTGQPIPVMGGGNIHARVFTPAGNGPFPIIVYYHGGGWVIADLDTYDASARGLAEQVHAVVVSVDYRQAPEHKFPTAHNDSYAAYEWVTKNVDELKGDSTRIAVVGESAGGNLAANVSIMARDKKITQPLHQVLIYPITSNNMNSESYQKYANAMPLNKPMMVWFMDNYVRNKNDANSPMISLVNANLKGLPPTTIITAEIDPLLSDGEMLSDKLKQAGVSVEYKKYNGVTHEFFGMASVVPEAKEAQAFAATQLQKAFEKEVKGN